MGAKVSISADIGRRESTPEVWSVSQVTRLVKNAVETGVGRVWIAGEISNWRVSPAGHAYFTLKDEHSQIGAVMFRGNMSRTRFEPENGLEVLAFGLVSVYEQRGVYQVVCEEMQPRGMGALQLAFEKLKAKLQAEGLFDEALKKPLPLLPRKIGIVTSPTGAAIRDVLNVIQRRYAHVHILLYPVRVQGDGAAAEVAEGIRRLDAHGVDVMIVGRGGGSLEDLWAFNEEVVGPGSTCGCDADHFGGGSRDRFFIVRLCRGRTRADAVGGGGTGGSRVRDAVRIVGCAGETPQAGGLAASWISAGPRGNLVVQLCFSPAGRTGAATAATL